LDCVSLVKEGFCAKYRLQGIEFDVLIKLFTVLEFDEYMSKTLFMRLVGYGGNWKKPLQYPFTDFFLFESGKGFKLSPSGFASLKEFETILRRVLVDREEYHRLKFGRYGQAEKQKRRENLPFYKDLTEAEQIAVLREYWAMPYQGATPKETIQLRRARKLAQTDLYIKYGLKGWDLTNAVIRFGEVVKSVRKRADIAHLFPEKYIKQDLRVHPIVTNNSTKL
jgi:hypothetical protein